MSDDERLEIAFASELYPAALRDLPDPPRRLYVRGDPAAMGAPCLAIIGSRRPTPYGTAVAQMAARVAAESGVTVVSGGALGCDMAAGTSALDAGGRHVAVLGSGADVAYPRRAAPMLRRILETGGAIVSLTPWGTQPMRWAFPKRNRVIAGLSAAVMVTEAGMPSGTFSTAEAAMEIGREVLAVPGSILSPLSRGANALISDGATCIVDADALETAISRIFGLLRFCRPGPTGIGGLSEEGRRVVAALTASPLRIEGIASMLGVGVHDAMMLVSELTVAGAVEQLLDGSFSVTAAALHAQAPFGHNGGPDRRGG